MRLRLLGLIMHISSGATWLTGLANCGLSIRDGTGDPGHSVMSKHRKFHQEILKCDFPNCAKKKKPGSQCPKTFQSKYRCAIKNSTRNWQTNCTNSQWLLIESVGRSRGQTAPMARGWSIPIPQGPGHVQRVLAQPRQPADRRRGRDSCGAAGAAAGPVALEGHPKTPSRGLTACASTAHSGHIRSAFRANPLRPGSLPNLPIVCDCCCTAMGSAEVGGTHAHLWDGRCDRW